MQAKAGDIEMAETAPRLLYLDDLAVGQTFSSGSYTLTEEKLKAFAAEYDPQPFHLDHDAARGTLFRGLAASGWQTAAITMRLLVESPVRLADGIIGAGGEIKWPHPTRAGDTLTVRTEVIELLPSRTRPKQGIVVMRSETVNQNGTVVQVLISRLVTFRRG